MRLDIVRSYGRPINSLIGYHSIKSLVKQPPSVLWRWAKLGLLCKRSYNAEIYPPAQRRRNIRTNTSVGVEHARPANAAPAENTPQESPMPTDFYEGL